MHAARGTIRENGRCSRLCDCVRLRGGRVHRAAEGLRFGNRAAAVQPDAGVNHVRGRRYRTRTRQEPLARSRRPKCGLWRCETNIKVSTKKSTGG
eukprot:834691-Prymnesium_polylepis.1